MKLLDQATRKDIRRCCRLNLPPEKKNELIEALDMLLQLPNPEGCKENKARAFDDISFDADYARRLNVYFQSENDGTGEEMVEIESMLSKIVRLTKPDLWYSRWDEYNTARANHQRADNPWMLSDLYREDGIKPWKGEGLKSYQTELDYSLNLDLDNEKTRYADIPVIRAYIACAQARNKGKHNNNATVDEFLFDVYLDVVYRHLDEIKAAYNAYIISSAIDREAFCRKVCQEYEESGMKYVDVKWRNRDKNSILTAKDIQNITSNRVVKILGNPGIGKTEALKNCRYLACKNYEPGSRIPVFVELKRLGDDSIKDAVSKQLGISGDDTENALEQGSVSLFLDGYNEITDLKKRSNVAAEISAYLSDSYPDLFIVISDRTVNTNPLVAGRAVVLELEPLDEEELVKLFEAKIEKYAKGDREQIEKCRNIFLDDGCIAKDYSNMIESEDATVLMVESMVKYTIYTGNAPDLETFDLENISALLKRESTDKNDGRIPAMCTILSSIARNVGPNDKINPDDLEQIIKEKMTAEALTERMEMIKLMEQLNFYYWDGDTYKFHNSSYKDYFYDFKWKEIF